MGQFQPLSPGKTLINTIKLHSMNLEKKTAKVINVLLKKIGKMQMIGITNLKS